MTTMLKKITQKELDIVIKNHRLWLAGDNNGQKADLSNHDLIGLDMSGSDMRWADIQHNANRVAARYDDIRRRPRCHMVRLLERQSCPI